MINLETFVVLYSKFQGLHSTTTLRDALQYTKLPIQCALTARRLDFQRQLTSFIGHFLLCKLPVTLSDDHITPMRAMTRKRMDKNDGTQ